MSDWPLLLHQETFGGPSVERRLRVGSVSSLMQDAAVGLLDVTYVSNQPNC